MTFKSISAGNDTAAADPVNGIVLSNTRTAVGNGGLTITGDGGQRYGSGGVIQNATGAPSASSDDGANLGSSTSAQR